MSSDVVLLDGRALGKELEPKILDATERLKREGIEPHLVVILVGDDEASHIYVRHKQREALRVGIKSTNILLKEATSQAELTRLIEKLNSNSTISAILLQLPLPPHIDSFAMLSLIAPSKDVDGFHPYNVGKLYTDSVNTQKSYTQITKDILALDTKVLEVEPYFIPATAFGVVLLMQSYGIKIKGARVVIIGTSNIVGKPLSNILLNLGATLSLCNIYTEDLSAYTKDADIIATAVGKAGLITPSMIKKGVVICDIGISRIAGSKKVVGDVDKSCMDMASYFTPVPGGVGPMTISALMLNVIKAAIIK